MYQFFVGIDVSKAVIDAFVKGSEQVQYLGQYKNDHNGFTAMLEALKKVVDCNSTHGLFCFENTGIYSKHLLEYLVSQQIPCREENPIQIKRSMGLKRGKNDQIDSLSICQYAYEKRDSIKVSQLDRPLITKLKKLLSRRELLLKQKIALQVSVKEGAHILDIKLRDFLSNKTSHC